MSRIHQALELRRLQERTGAEDDAVDAPRPVTPPAVHPAAAVPLRAPKRIEHQPGATTERPGPRAVDALDADADRARRRSDSADVWAPPDLSFEELRPALADGDVEAGRRWPETLTTHPEANPTLVEQFRKLAAVLHQAQLQHGTRTVTVASAMRGEGKTLTAANLALTLARSYGRRVVLVDADLRDASLHELFGCARVPGLTDLIAGGGDPDSEFATTPVTPLLSVIAAGTMTPDPISTLSSERFREILERLAARFDWIVVDIPPVGALPDAGLLTSLSDTTILVVQAGCAAYPLVQRAAEAIGPDRILGVVLNMVPQRDIVAAYGDAGVYPESDGARPS